ncbi:MAG: class I SAM-dependent methyltransferase [Anaerolineales bacterium]
MNLERYHLYHEHHRRESDDLPFWLRVADVWGRAGTLELGCGTGRVYHALQQAGFPTFGVDLDPGMLAVLWMQNPSSAAVFLGDMRSLGLRAASMGLVILPCNTFSTFEPEDQARIAAETARLLRPQGAFVVAMPNPLLLADVPPHGDPEPETTFPHPLTGEPVQVFSAWQRDGQVFEVQWVYQCGQRRHSWRARHILQPPQASVQLLERHGLEVTTLFGGFDGAPFGEDAEMLGIIAEKR